MSLPTPSQIRFSLRNRREIKNIKKSGNTIGKSFKSMISKNKPSSIKSLFSFGSRKKHTKRRSAPKARRSRSRKQSRKQSRKRSRSSILKAKKTRCSNLLKKKISINMKELKKGKFKNRAQAIAVSYSQVKKKYPSCAKMYRR